MTSPTSPFDAITPSQEQDALDNITRMMTGTQMLQDQPGVVYALQQQKAHPADAQAIDQFMQGLDAEKQVRLAQASSQKIVLSSDQKTRLDALGMDYSTVEYTHQDAVNQTAQLIEQQSGGKQMVKRNADGSVALDANGQIQTIDTAEHYKAKGIGRLFHDLNNWVAKPVERDVLSPAMTGLNKAYNLVNYNVSTAFGLDVPDSIASADMRAQGYDPTSVWSSLAYESSGHAHGERLKPLVKEYGQDKIDQALQFVNDPKGFRQAIENDPANYAMVGTQQVMTDAGKAKLAAINSPEFEKLARRIGATSATWGNVVANDLGIDPVKHSTAYAITSAGANLAAAFMVDPFIVAGTAYKVAKFSQVGIDTLGDAERAASILDATKSTGPAARGLQRRTQSFIDMTHQMGEAEAAGDTAKAAGLTARIGAQFPEWAPMVPDVLGKNQITGFAEKVVDGKKIAEPVFGEGEPIRNLADMSGYIASQSALIRLMNGRAAAQASLMPGSVSNFGLRAVKGAGAQWMTERSAVRAQRGFDAVVSKASADPGLAEKLIDSGDLVRTQPEADDAIQALTDQVVADKQLASKWEAEHKTALASGDQELIDSAAIASQNAQGALAASQGKLASAQRAASKLELTPSGKGNVALNMRRYGDPLGDGGWARPAAVAARGRLAAQRLSTLLPRNTLIELNDAASSDKVYKLAMTYLNRGDANALRAAWNTGDGGQRKAIIGGLIDQLGHAAGLGKSVSGQRVLDAAKTKLEAYSSVGDDVMIDGQSVALHAGQVRTTWTLPTFQQLQHASAKMGLYEATMGRALTSSQADLLMQQWKLGALFKPSTVTRNQLEGWLRTALEGKFGDAVKAKAIATMPMKELWKRGLALESKAKHAELVAGGKLEEADQLAKSTMLGGDVLGRSGVSQRIADFAPFALAGRAYRHITGKTMDEETLAALATLSPEELSHAMEGYGQQILESDLGFRNAARQSTEVAKAGYGPALLRRAVNRSMRKADKGNPETAEWRMQETGDMIGAERYANALAQRVNPTPGVAKAVLDFIENPASAPRVGTPLKRWSTPGEDVTNPFAHGTHFNIDRPGEGNIFEHGAGKTKYEALGLPLNDKRVLSLSNYDANDFASTGLSALKHLAGDGEFERLTNLSLGDLKAEVTKKFPDADLSKMNSYTRDQQHARLMEAYGALLAKAKGYAAVHVKDPENPAFDEFLALTPDAFSRGYDISHVVTALDDPAIRAEMHLTGYGSVYWTDPAKEALKATTPEEVLLGKQEWANKVVNDYRYLLTGQNGQYQQELATYMRTTGKAPDADWITNKLIGDHRPHAVLAPEVTAVPSGGERGLINALQDVEGAAYQWMVERPLQRTTSSPVFLANYAQVRKGLNPMVAKLVDQGISEEAAGNLAKELAVRNSWVKTEGLIDDPGQKSQFDVVARNIFPFSRATQAMIRRWGGGMWQDPTRARKMMLAYEGSVQSGLVYDNAYGEPTFVYPGSGVMNMLMRDIAKIPGFQGLARFPVSASMTGGVLMSVPGADNPLRMSAGPMITIPLREISKLLPGDQKVIFDEVDSAINGPIGVGKTFSQLEPTLAKRFFGAMDENQRNSALASSTVGAIANLAAAGMVPSADASPAEREAFIKNVQTQVRSQLFVRAVFGIFAPASPSQPSEGTAGSQADYAFHITGSGQLSDEYKAILNDVGGDLGRANAIWTAMHPESTVYEVSHTQATASKVSLPATKEALTWLNTNAGFVKKYGSVAAYFLPQGTGKEPFSDQAYKAQIELGLRQRKTPTEFMNDLYVRNAEAVFYPTVDKMNAQIAALKAAGQDTSQMTQAKSQWETDFKNMNPLFGQKIDSYGDARAAATGQLANLRQMLKEGSVPDGQAKQLGQLITAYDGYEAFTQAHKGQTKDEIAARDSALQMFDQWANTHLAGTNLADLYNGVFRTLNSNFAKLGGA